MITYTIDTNHELALPYVADIAARASEILGAQLETESLCDGTRYLVTLFVPESDTIPAENRIACSGFIEGIEWTHENL